MSETKQMLLRELLITSKDGDWGKAVREDGYLPYSVIRATDFEEVALGQGEKVPVRYLRAKTVERRTLQVDDILIETAGGSPGRPTGRTMLVTDRALSAFSRPITCASFARFLRVDRNLADPRYVYWYLQSLYQSGEIERYQVQHTGVARFQYTNFASTHKFPVIAIRDQHAIAELLGAIDDKIATNEKILRVAEDLTHTSYQSLINDSTPQRVKVRNLVRRISPKRKFNKDDLLLQGDFPVFDQSQQGLLGYLNGEGFLDANTENPILYFGDHTCKLRIVAQAFTVGPNTVPFTGINIPALTLYCALTGIQQHEEYKRHWSLLMEKEILVPNEEKSEKFASRHGHLLTLVKTLTSENASLVSTRNTLLPKLMSGNLRARDAEELVECTI